MTLRPNVLRWARERVGYDPDTLAGKLGIKPERVWEWEASGRITIAQAQNLAHHTYTPEGFLYLSEPPDERLPIADFRTLDGQPVRRPSPNLLDTVYLMQARQEWLHDERLIEEANPLDFVGAFPNGTAPDEIAANIRDVLDIESDWASQSSSWSEALRFLRDRLEDAGILVFFNGIVGNNTHRKLDRDEFQGFALVDDYAPLIFVNSADYKAAQMFTLAHELAHVFVGVGGLSSLDALQPSPHGTEIHCNSIAAEFLIESQSLHVFWDSIPRGQHAFQAIAREYKVSEIVAARRALDLNLVDRDTYFEFYRSYVSRLQQTGSNTGGDFWNNQNVRIGRIFGSAIVRAVREGRLLYREAYVLTGLNGRTFDSFVQRMENSA